MLPIVAAVSCTPPPALHAAGSGESVNAAMDAPSSDAAAAAPAVLVRARTADGADLALKRLVHEDGPPVLFLHGLAVNADLWNLPAVTTNAYAYVSLAETLHRQGYDVWLLNFRGHGNDGFESLPPAAQADWTVDDFVLYDLPAALDAVRAANGRRPFIIAASMGAMALAGYLQGATLQADAAEPRIVADVGLAAARQAGIAAAVFVELPAALRWPDSPISADGRILWDRVVSQGARTDADANFAFELLSRADALAELLEFGGGIPLRWLRPSTPVAALRERLPKAVQQTLNSAERVLTQLFISMIGVFNGAAHYRVEIFLQGKRHVVDDIKSGVLRQMAACVRARGFVSTHGDPPHVYSDHYANITLPTLVVAGGRDRIAHAGVTREAFFDRISAADKRFLLFERFGHGEFEIAPEACVDLYPQIVTWLAERRERP